MASFHDLSTAQLKQAVQIREQIEELQSKLENLLGGGGTAPKAKADQPSKGKRVLSAATKKKMAAAQQARWAKIKGTPAKAAPTKALAKAAASATPKKKGAITAEGRKKLSAMMKARWDARKKGAPAPNASAN